MSAIEADASQILYFEPLRIATPAAAQFQQKTASRELQFDAYGRRFVLSLEPNEKLSPLLQSKSGTASMQLYRGQIQGAAGSWARIAITDGQMHGMLWDGAELYVIESLATVHDSLPANTPTDTDSTVIFRLADVLMKPGATSCGAGTSGSKGSDAYGSLVSELKSAPAIMQAAGASRRLEISALGDGLFLNRYGTEEEARNQILARLNDVDGIYSSQLGIEIQVPSIDLGDALSTTTLNAESLLKELGNLRQRSPNLSSRGLTHLFTGRDLEGSTAGIAYVDTLCNSRMGVGLTEASGRLPWIESLIAAHEIGHNFGAVHDGDAEEACASTPAGQYLMSPSISPNNDRFSSCSLGLMQPNAAQANCITALPAADISVAADLGVAQGPIGRAFAWSVTVRNAGGVATTNTRAQILVPPVVSVEDAYVVGGSCTSGAGLIQCQLGDIAGGNSATVQLSLRSDSIGSNSVSVEVSAANEVRTDNNRGEGSLSIVPEADLALSLQGPASVAAGDSFNVAIAASNLSGIDASTVVIDIELPAGVTATSATLNGASCSLQSNSIQCPIGSLAPGATVTGNASLRATTAGSALLRGRVSGSYWDPIASNNVSEVTISVAGTVSAAVEGGNSGGGGGSSGALLLTLLSALLGMKNLQRRSTR